MPAVQTAVLPGSQVDRSGRALLFGVALTSFSALLLELALTRLFSVVLFYHFAFLAISIALLGLGAGGVFAYLGKQRLAKFETRRLAAMLCAINSVAVFVVLEIVLQAPPSHDVQGVLITLPVVSGTTACWGTGTASSGASVLLDSLAKLPIGGSAVAAPVAKAPVLLDTGLAVAFPVLVAGPGGNG